MLGKNAWRRTGIGILTAAALLWAGFAQAGNHENKTQTAKIGEKAPDFELTGTDGKTYKLSDYSDKIVVLEWFNMRCPFCKGAAQMMKETSDKYAEKDVVWLAIDSTAKSHQAYADADAINAFAKKEGLKYPFLKDEDGKVGKTYSAKTTPHIFIINKGELVYVGGHASGTDTKPGDRNYIAETLDALLAGKPVPAAKTVNRGCTIKYAK